MPAIDVHVHVAVPEILRASAPGEPWRPDVTEIDGRPHVVLAEKRVGSIVGPLTDAEAILAGRAAVGIDGVVLCPWVALLYSDAPPELALERCRIQNAGLARMRELDPERIAVLGGLPMQDPELAATELETLMAGGVFAGVEVTASVAGVSIGDQRFAPFWAAAEASRAFVFIHPTTRAFPQPPFGEHYLWNLVGNPMETTVAAAHLVLGGTLARHPDLRVMLAHGGGAILALSGRLRHGQRSVAAAGPPPAHAAPAADVLVRRFHFDTITHDPQRLAELIAAVGAERVLLGSDQPFDMADPDPVATVRAAGLAPAAEAAVLAGNARRELWRGQQDG